MKAFHLGSRSRVKALLVRMVLGLAAVLSLVAVSIFLGSEWILRRRHDLALEMLASPVAGSGTAEGRRRAVLFGCLKGCHGPNGEGGEEEAPGIFSVTAPTLSAVLPDYSDAELVRLVRFGVKRNGKSAVGMPAGTFFPMSNGDLALIFGYLRAQPLVRAVPRHQRILPLGRLALVLGKWKLSADQVDETMPRWGELPRATAFARGRYLASVICSECHGLDFKGLAYFPSPSLAIVNGYYPDQFHRLVRTGEHLSGRTDGMMAKVAREAFVEFSDEEIDDLYAFFTVTFADVSLAMRPEG
jgi:mono/diheme cytochrome c family protein